MILALAGGVGGARLANGLAASVAPGALTIVVNTGDDFEHLGLRISPDIDTVTYTLAGLNNRELGWGRRDESWNFMEVLSGLGGEDWFRLGDRDLALHIYRSERLKAGGSLSEVTQDVARSMGIDSRIVPMSDDPVRSIVATDEGELAFQHYFVRRRCAPVFRGIRFEGAERAKASAGFVAALEDSALEAIVICPSNPLLSIAPILAVPGIAERLRARTVPLVAVSPFIGGKAVKGPAAKIMEELGLSATAAAVAAHYDDLVDGLVIDAEDSGSGAACDILATDTLMRDEADQARLAGEVLAFARALRDGQ